MAEQIPDFDNELDVEQTQLQAEQAQTVGTVEWARTVELSLNPIRRFQQVGRYAVELGLPVDRSYPIPFMRRAFTRSGLVSSLKSREHARKLMNYARSIDGSGLNEDAHTVSDELDGITTEKPQE